MFILCQIYDKIVEPQFDKNNKMTITPKEDSDQSKRRPSLIRVFSVRPKDS